MALSQEPAGYQDESLKQRYSVEEYYKEIKKVNKQFNGDLEFLAYMAEDHVQDHVLRLFAVAAMGDYENCNGLIMKTELHTR